jgi:hypothetical protein
MARIVLTVSGTLILLIGSLLGLYGAFAVLYGGEEGSSGGAYVNLNGTDISRRHHRHAIELHFSRHLSDTDVKAITRAFEKISDHARPLRPGRIRS